MELETLKKSKSSRNQEYHIRLMKDLIYDGKNLLKIPNFNSTSFYDRRDGSGWWMPMKQFVIRSYVRQYLTILGKKKFIQLYFIDPLASYGMNKLTKSQGKDVFIFPGTALNAALISQRTIRGFDGFYINDRDSETRKVLINRFSVFSQSIDPLLIFNIESPEKNNVDSNKWLINVLNNISEDKYANYLIVIDNQGMDIGYETIRMIRQIHPFGDVIITFHDTAFSRSIHNIEKNRFFYGIDVNENTTIEDRRNLYIDQLRGIGFGRIEPIHVRSEGGFFYTLLFCCRENVSAKWLEMIEFLREVRYKNCTDSYLKNIYDIAIGKSNSIDSFL